MPHLAHKKTDTTLYSKMLAVSSGYIQFTDITTWKRDIKRHKNTVL